jgi:Tfp pilus assembly protein PilP
MLKYSMIAALLLAIGCGGDDESGDGEAPTKQRGGNQQAAAAAAAPVGVLKTYVHVEDVVTPEEKDTIRHVFQERDFMVDLTGGNRDPFQSFVVRQIGLADDQKPTIDPSIEKCANKPIQASSYSITELKLSGIVARGTKHFALMQDTKGFGWIIGRGDCVGREKAPVKDIGGSSITFEVAPQASASGTARATPELSVKLYPDELPLNPGDPRPRDQSGTPAVMPNQNVAPSTPPSGASGSM